MNRVIIIFLALNFSPLFSARNLYAYSPERIDISDYEFYRYIRPQLKSIHSEYRSLFFQTNEHLEGFKNIYDAALNLRSDLYEYKDNLSAEKKFNLLKVFRKHIQLIIGGLDQKILKDRPVFKTQLEDLNQYLIHANIGLDNLITEYIMSQSWSLSHKKILRELKEIYLKTNLLLLNHAKDEFKVEFTDFWHNFITLTQEQILWPKNKNYLKEHLGELQVTWSSFQVVLTKRNFKISKKSYALIKLMTNRWINILKLSLITNHQ